jgi:uncharacterized protein RhaS with RHS repeats
VTGLYYTCARWYDPATGEFFSVDPAFNETLDAYGYLYENRLAGTDPSGLMACSAVQPGQTGTCGPSTGSNSSVTGSASIGRSGGTAWNGTLVERLAR